MVIIKFIAWITDGKLVYLQDHDGEVVVSIAYPDPFGYLRCYRYWATRIGHCLLDEGGTVRGTGYVKRWKFVDKS